MHRVLVVDSGVGGLSVVRAIREIAPEVAIVYLADNAWFPYGRRSESELTERLLHLLEEAFEAYPCNAAVLACNTASTVVLDALRARFTTKPIVGVVPPIKTAGELSKTRVIGLLATEATVERPYVKKLAAQFAADCKLVSIGSARLAEMAEEKLRGEPVDLDLMRTILAPFFDDSDAKVDTVVLGCTHYPLLLEDFKKVSPPGVQWLDSSPAIARRVEQVLQDLPSSSGSLSDHTLFTAPLREDAALIRFLRDLRLPAPMILTN
jgi:glutamate racemase